MGATNRLDCIDAALLRKGRFHQIIHVPLPTAAERLALVHYFAAKCRLPEASIGSILASRAYAKADLSGADVENLVKQEMMRLAQTAVSAE
jgi:SpoVK/Ycf46/Vps4 family AAA+-type ATPase